MNMTWDLACLHCAHLGETFWEQAKRKKACYICGLCKVKCVHPTKGTEASTVPPPPTVSKAPAQPKPIPVRQAKKISSKPHVLDSGSTDANTWRTVAKAVVEVEMETAKAVFDRAGPKEMAEMAEMAKAVIGRAGPKETTTADSLATIPTPHSPLIHPSFTSTIFGNREGEVERWVSYKDSV